MPRIMRRTPTTEEAASYGLRDLMREIVGRTVRETREGFRRDPTRLSGEEILELGLAGIGAGTKIARGLGKGKFPFSVKTTDIPFWDAILRKPAYHKEAKGIERRIEFMSPEEYMQRISEGGVGVSSKTQRAALSSKQIAKYAREMEEGAVFPMPGIEHRKAGKFMDTLQEGRHRAIAAEKLGIDRIPVLIMRELRPEQKLMERFSKEGLKYDAFTEPLPGYGYHQWTLYGETPAKGATFGTKTTSLEEMEKKIADLMRSFSK